MCFIEVIYDDGVIGAKSIYTPASPKTPRRKSEDAGKIIDFIISYLTFRPKTSLI